ncbi:MAG: shikimate kinase [Ignavibacteriales bacterium]|nr:shikimate kinase [Ignavibacteriales bacterium]
MKKINRKNSKFGKNIAFIGFRGTGKSTIAKLLGKKLKRNYYSIDAIVEKKFGETISSLVKTKGWKYFRDLECNELKAMNLEREVIIDCGGGIVLRKKNRELLRKNSFVVLLEADVDTIEKRISKDKNRIRLSKKKTLREEIESQLLKRNKYYEELADVVFNSSQLTKEVIVSKIIFSM